jgi:hypothetical protein
VFGVLRGVGMLDFSTISSWNKDSGWTNKYCFFNNNSLANAISVSNYFTVANISCNRLITSTPNNIASNEVNGISHGGGKSLYVSVVGIEAISDLKAYFAENETYMHYPLATPTFEPLPLADQIALHKLESFGGVTYLFTDSTIEPIIEVEYGTSKVGGYAIKGLNTADANALMIE